MHPSIASTPPFHPMKANGEPDLRVVGECTLDAHAQPSDAGRYLQVGFVNYACLWYTSWHAFFSVLNSCATTDVLMRIIRFLPPSMSVFTLVQSKSLLLVCEMFEGYDGVVASGHYKLT